MSEESSTFSGLDYQSFLRASPALLVLVSRQLTILDASETYLKATHKSRERDVGRPILEVFSADPNEPEGTNQIEVRNSMEKVLATGLTDRIGPLRYDVELPEGGFEERYWNLTTSPVLGSDGKVREIIHHAEEVTAEVLLRRSEEAERIRAHEAEAQVAAARVREKEILESFTDAFFALDKDWTFTYVNAHAERILGRAPGDLLGLSLWDVYPGLEGSEFQTAYLYTAKEQVPVSFTAFYPDHGRWYEVHTYPGIPTGITIYFRDATERMQAEEALRQANERLEHRVEERTQELQEAVREAEAFNYSISHDLRSPLRAIISTARIVRDECEENLQPDHLELLDRQVKNATRLGLVIDELLRLSRLARVEVKRERLDLTHEVHSVAEELGQSHRIAVQDGMLAYGDPGLVRIVITNLIDNASKFSANDTSIQVGQNEGTTWVKDEGVGFDMKFANKLFRPFERLVTEREFPGTGIGLASVERIVKRHGGKVWAESAPGRGTTFFFTLA